MIRVALETATARGSVAVARDDRVLAEVMVGVQRRHAETMLPALESALALAGTERTAIGEVVVGAGPGSFTGVRVAGAMAKGLATGLDVPLRAYSSLLAVAAAVPAPAADGVCALLDARRGEVYAGCWRVDESTVEEVLAPRVGPIERVLEALDRAHEAAGAINSEAVGAPKEHRRAPLFVGDGAARYRDALESAGGRVATVPAYPRASTLLWLAHRHPALGDVDGAAWEPDYVRASGAERGIAG